MKNQEKTARALRIAAVCLIAVLVAVLGVSAAYARYTYHASGKDQARVAKLNVVVEEVKESEKQKIRWNITDNEIDKPNPGSYGATASYVEKFTVTNLSEVVVGSTAVISGIPAKGWVRIKVTRKNGEESYVTTINSDKVSFNESRNRFDVLISDEASVDAYLGELDIGEQILCTVEMGTRPGATVGVSGSKWENGVPNSISMQSNMYNQNLHGTIKVRSVQID